MSAKFTIIVAAEMSFSYASIQFFVVVIDSQHDPHYAAVTAIALVVLTKLCQIVASENSHCSTVSKFRTIAALNGKCAISFSISSI